MTPEPAVHRTRIRVRGYHCDFYGHVNNARYLEFLEEARWQYLEEGLDLAQWKDRGLGFVVARVVINYRRPAGLNAELEISSWQKEVGRKSGVISQEVRDFAAENRVSEEEAIAVGMEGKAADFRAGGGELYVSPETVD